ncbi:hypothetical protein PhaeoP128_02718 [Phaeobacter gallaeciensis]|nr:hypothetical protein PhaeoP129_02717 [Phaeobacter gallaeciensis]ATF23436.1 hypothetical protein PhaeoP128_02718 [Phaeobacter gallaeciensis]
MSYMLPCAMIGADARRWGKPDATMGAVNAGVDHGVRQEERHA